MNPGRTGTLTLLALLTSLGAPAGAIARTSPQGPPPASYVDPFTGTAASAPDFGTGGGAGNTFPGAAAPFGMVAWSPQTIPGTVNIGGGYSYADHQLSGFSLTHLSGPGCEAGGDVSILPTTHPVDVSPATLGSSNLNPAYVAAFSHRDERGRPGYYQVELDPGGARPISTALTATVRAGVGQFTFPATPTASVLINAGASANADTLATVRIDPATRTVTGSAASGRFCYQRNRYRVYFAVRVDRPIRTYGTWTKQLLTPRSTRSYNSSPGAINYTPFPGGPPSLPGNPSGTAQAGAYLTFDTTRNRVVQMRVGLSYVSAGDALRNLQAEVGKGTFGQVRARTTRAWNRELSRISVEGGSLRARRTFYTALYHVLLQPSVFSDDDGRYMGMDGHVHTAQTGHAQYANFSGWDIYRSQIPLLAMLEPRRASDMAQSLVNDARQSGWLPKWSLANGQTNVMVGDSADPIIAGAYAFGAHGFDLTGALRAMVRGASVPAGALTQYVERPGLADYQRLGYVPHQDNGTSVQATFHPQTPWGSVSTTLEYATDDFTLAQFAAAAGCDRTDFRRFLKRSGNWNQVFDPALRVMAARSDNGSFVPHSSPTSTADFVEGDAAQYTWMVPFDLRGLFSRLGGRRAALARLDAFFSRLNGGPDATTAFLGNEPTLQTPWEYDWLGEPWRAQAVIRRALHTLYGPGPAGLPGNDDLGEMSSWYVLGAVGLYPEVPGRPILALGSPLFPRIALRLGTRRITLDSTGVPGYVHGLTVGGKRYDRPWITFSALVRGQAIHFRLGPAPDRHWGADPKSRPPSYPATSAPPGCQRTR